MKREYIKTGKCIWCGRTKEDGASFDHVPHILPKALGGQETCTDVCNDCNSFFGDDRSKYGISQDEAVKGIHMEVIFLLLILLFLLCNIDFIVILF